MSIRAIRIVLVELFRLGIFGAELLVLDEAYFFSTKQLPCGQHQLHQHHYGTDFYVLHEGYRMSFFL